MDKTYIIKLADKLEELLKSGKLAGTEARAGSVIKMLRNDIFSLDQKGQFVAMAEKLISGERTANKNNYSGMFERLNTLLNDNYLDEESNNLVINLVNRWKHSDMSDEEKEEWFQKAESLFQTIKEKKLLQQASSLLKDKGSILGPEIVMELDNAINAVINSEPENRSNSITILEDTLKQCHTILEGSHQGK